MAGVPNNFQITTPPAIATYNYTDIADGTGVTAFYLTQFNSSSGVTYGLTNQAMRSYSILNSLTYTGAVSWTLKGTYNYDLGAFNRPKTIKGTAYVNGYRTNQLSGGNSQDCYFVFTIKKWDGTTATSIGSAQTATIAGGATEQITLPITLTQTIFKRGDVLRVTVDIYCQTSVGTGAGIQSFGNDPAGRTTTSAAFTASDMTNTAVYIPERLI